MIDKVCNDLFNYISNIDGLKKQVRDYKQQLKDSNLQNDNSAQLNFERYEQILNQKLKIKIEKDKIEANKADPEQYKNTFINYIEGTLKYRTLELLMMYNDFSKGSLNINVLPENFKIRLNSISNLLNGRTILLKIQLGNNTLSDIEDNEYKDENGQQTKIDLFRDSDRIIYDNFTKITTLEAVKDWLLFIVKAILTVGILPLAEVITGKQYFIQSNKYNKEQVQSYGEFIVKNQSNAELKAVGINL